MYQCFQLNINEALQKMTDTSFCLNKIKNKITKRVLEEIYLLYVSNTYHMNFECVQVHCICWKRPCWCIDVNNSSF